MFIVGHVMFYELYLRDQCNKLNKRNKMLNTIVFNLKMYLKGRNYLRKKFLRKKFLRNLFLRFWPIFAKITSAKL